MANPKCAGCGKTVYVVERMDCLDKPWHRWCFKCSTCGITLNLKSYRGMGGVPYCQTHYPMPTSANNDPTYGLESGQQSYAVQDPYGGEGGAAPAPGGYDAAPAAGGYAEPAYDDGGYEDQGGYDDQGGYEDQGGYDDGGYAEEPAYDDGGYDEGGYEEPAAGGGEGYVGQARALYDYAAEDDDELSFATGDIINITEFVDDGWWQGELNGAVGLFPASYSELIE